MMKTREAFERIRKQKMGISLRVRLVLTVSMELVISVLLALAVSALLESLLPETVKIPLMLELIVLSLLVGTFMTSLKQQRS